MSGYLSHQGWKGEDNTQHPGARGEESQPICSTLAGESQTPLLFHVQDGTSHYRNPTGIQLGQGAVDWAHKGKFPLPPDRKEPEEKWKNT